MVLAHKLLEEARDFPRKHCSWPGVLKHEGVHRPCVVEDISAGGCRVAVKSKGLTFNDKVVIEVESRKLRFHGEIRWIRLDEAGVEFLFMD
ncbi:PilZ domain-containing protein [Roseibium aggregatum]|uniref:PilZ domain-containing protein n=1 Tax=Roseibium aggregatum TaxID=187304 RepID=A0A939J3C4_9HYPH|nr:PilZ domain-containing protein [Roseibium aggregatum]MBN9669990.1 PilZ domain-containing protein [Roseibium aggregatum]